MILQCSGELEDILTTLQISPLQHSIHLTPSTDSSGRELGESVIFQPVLQACPTHHPWIITAHFPRTPGTALESF